MLKFWTFHDNPRSSLKLQTWKNDFKWISYIIKHRCSYKMWTFGDIECDCKLVLACWCEKSEFFMFLTTCFAFIGHVTVQNYVIWIRWIREIIFLKKLCWAHYELAMLSNTEAQANVSVCMPGVLLFTVDECGRKPVLYAICFFDRPRHRTELGELDSLNTWNYFPQKIMLGTVFIPGSFPLVFADFSQTQKSAKNQRKTFWSETVVKTILWGKWFHTFNESSPHNSVRWRALVLNASCGLTQPPASDLVLFLLDRWSALICLISWNIRCRFRSFCAARSCVGMSAWEHGTQTSQSHVLHL